MKKIFLLLLFLIPISIKGLEINKLYIDSELDIAGNLVIKEIIEVEDFNENLKLNILYKDINASDNQYGYSNIHNSSEITLTRIGYLDKIIDISNKENVDKNIRVIESFQEDKKDGYLNILINKNKKEKYLYLEYILLAASVKYNDASEIYYKYLSDFNYDVKDVKIIFRLPFKSEIFEVFAHGNIKAKVTKDIENSIVLCEINNYRNKKNFDLRVLFDKEIFAVSINKNKISNINALDKIKEFETKKNNIILPIVIGIFVIVILIILTIKINKSKK